MAKPNPFGGKRAAPFGAGKGKAPPFEKSSRDVDPKGMKEGSPADMALDRKQMFKRGGGVKRGR